MKRLTLLSMACLVVTTPMTIQAQETIKAVRGDLKMDVNLGGVFVADDKDEIQIEPHRYSGDLIVTRIVAEGITVKEGDLLLEFDSAKLDEAIVEAENEASDALVELKKAQAEYQTAIIDRDSKQVETQTELESLKRELEAAKARQVLEIEEKKRGIIAAQESLEQLEVDKKMLEDIYKEREMQTSTSGDILLARQEKQIENAKKGIELSRRELEYFEKFDLSKDQLDKQLEIEKKAAEQEKQVIMLAAEVVEKDSLVTKAQRKVDAADEKVRLLNEDRQQLQILSPREGVVFYGATDNELPAGIIIGGSGMRNVRDELRIGGRIKTHEILLTIATMKHLSIKMQVPEDDIQHLKNELPITVYPDAFPKDSFKGKLTKVDQIATAFSFYINAEKRFKVMGKCTDLAPLLRSGMNCRVTIHAEAVKDAIQIPVSSVVARDGKFFCFVKNGTGFERRQVEIGFSNPVLVQIVEGLNENEEVLISPRELSDDSNTEKGVVK